MFDSIYYHSDRHMLYKITDRFKARFRKNWTRSDSDTHISRVQKKKNMAGTDEGGRRTAASSKIIHSRIQMCYIGLTAVHE